MWCRYGMAFFVFATSNFVLTLFAAIITAFISPTAAGSGIPEVKAYLNGVDAPGIFSLRTLGVKVENLQVFWDIMAYLCFTFPIRVDTWSCWLVWRFIQLSSFSEILGSYGLPIFSTTHSRPLQIVSMWTVSFIVGSHHILCFVINASGLGCANLLDQLLYEI